MVKEPYKLEQYTYSKISKDSQIYYSLDFVAKKLNMSPECLIYLMEEITIELDEKLPSFNKLKPSLDIGLKFFLRF